MKTIVISGGQGDIAQAIKIEMEQEYLVYCPSKEEMDVRSYDSVLAYLTQIKPDVMINNAGYVYPQSITAADMGKELKSIEINLLGVFNCAAVALMLNRNVQLINVGSSAATKAHATWSSYCATKAGVVMATKCWAEDGVNAICLSPGRTATKMRTSLFRNEDPETLLKVEDFAKIVRKTIAGEYPVGAHIDVTVSNIKELLNDA